MKYLDLEGLKFYITELIDKININSERQIPPFKVECEFHFIKYSTLV